MKALFSKSPPVGRTDEDSLPPDDESSPPPDEEYDDETPIEYDLPSEDGSLPADYSLGDDDLPPDDDLPSDDDDDPSPDDNDLLPADDEDEPPFDDEDQPPVEAKRPSRRISRPRVDSAEIFADMDDSSLQDSAPPAPPLSTNAKARGSGGGGPVSKSKPPPPPPPGPPPKTLMAQRLQSGQKQPAVKYSENSIEEDLASLSVGLQVSVPLKLDHSKAKEALSIPPSAKQLSSDVQVSKPQGKGAIQRDSLIAAFDNIDFSPAEVMVSAQPRLEKEIINSASLDVADFIMLQGCFDGDPYEQLGIKSADFSLQIYIQQEEKIVEFDLHETRVEGHQNDAVHFTLASPKYKIFFKASNAGDRKKFFTSLPDGIIDESGPSMNTSGKISLTVHGASGGGPAATRNTLPPSRASLFSPPPLSEMSTTAMLRTDAGLNAKDLAQLLNLDEDIINAGNYIEGKDDNVKGHSRSELVDTHIRKPHVCVRKAKLICKWLTSLHLQKEPITVQNYHLEFCTGVLLSKLIKYVIPSAEFPLLTERALSRGAAIKNIELSLAIIWRSKSVNSSRIATAAEMFEGNKLKIMVMLEEVFDVYVRRALYKKSVKMLKWYHTILKQYNRRIPVGVFTESDFSAVWNVFQSGTALFLIIYHLFGPNMIGDGQNVTKVDPMRVVNKPANIIEYRSNICYVFSLLRALNIEICWDPMDFITFPDPDFTMIQLEYIYEALKERHCVLPPAMGSQAGVTSGANGDPLVVGIVFSDTITVSIPVHAPVSATGMKKGAQAAPVVKKRSVGMVGIGEESIALLAIDSSGRLDRFNSTVCPFGLLSMNMKVAMAPITLQGTRLSKEKKSWLTSVQNDASADRAVGDIHVENLKEKNKITSASEMKSSAFLIPGELIVHEYTRDGYRSKTLPVDTTGTIPTASAPTLSVETVSLAIEKLEKDMSEAEAGIDAAEEALADKYIALEGQSHTMSSREYDKMLLDLDKAKAHLEEQRKKLQEGYGLRMDSIRAQHAEAVARADAIEKSIETGSTASRTSSALSPMKASIKRNQLTSPSSQSISSSRVTPQKKWVTVDLNKSHNVVLRKHAENSVKVAKSKLVPPSRRDKVTTDEQSLMNISSLGDKDTKLHRIDDTVANLSVEESWSFFKSYLKKITDVWGTDDAKIRKKSKVSKVADSQEIASQMQMTGGSRIASNAIRKEELAFMALEDKRRKLYLKQLDQSRSADTENVESRSRPKAQVLSDSHTSVILKLNESKLDQFSRSKLQSNDSAEIKLSSIKLDPANFAPKDEDAALKWWSSARQMQLVDRASMRVFYFCLIKDATDKKLPTKYSFAWKEKIQSTSYDGFISLDLVRDLSVSPKDESIFVLSVDESSPIALKTTGGRTVISVKCNSDVECMKYYASYSFLRRGSVQQPPS